MLFSRVRDSVFIVGSHFRLDSKLLSIRYLTRPEDTKDSKLRGMSVSILLRLRRTNTKRLKLRRLEPWQKEK